MIPALTHHGVLPPGVHDSTFAEIEARFATNDHRLQRWWGFQAYYEDRLEHLRKLGLIASVLFGGSFVTNKAAPDDVDILVEITPAFAVQLFRTPRLREVFDHAITEPYMVQAKPWAPTAPPHANLLLLWQKPSDEDMVERGIHPDDRKGVLKVML